MITAIILTTLVSVSQVEDKVDKAYHWTNYDTYLELSLVPIAFLDVMQTRYALSHPKTVCIPTRYGDMCHPVGYQESNPALGPYPSAAKLYFGTVGVLLLHAAISYCLPSPYREIWQTVTFGLEIANDINTMTMVGGLKLSF